MSQDFIVPKIFTLSTIANMLKVRNVFRINFKSRTPPGKTSSKDKVKG